VTHKIRERTRATSRLLLQAVFWGSVPGIVLAQASPFMTGMTSLQANILSWLTPVAIILVMVLGGMAMASRIGQVAQTYGNGEAQTMNDEVSFQPKPSSDLCVTGVAPTEQSAGLEKFWSGRFVNCPIDSTTSK
jgi:hypothetical protein